MKKSIVVTEGGKCYEVRFRRYRIDPNTGKKIYPKKARVFPMRFEVPCPTCPKQED